MAVRSSFSLPTSTPTFATRTTPAAMHSLTHLNIFSGSGGFELAAEAVGWENIASCEINRYARQLLTVRFPDTHIHTDATNTDWRRYRYAIDVLSLSPPCQPHSLSGKRGGSDDDRDLLDICPRILDDIRPRAAILENVPGLLSSESGMAIRRLLSRMESAGDGYSCLPILIPAGATGALHLRYRLWVVAYANAQRRQPGRFPSISGEAKKGAIRIPHFDPYEPRLRAAGKSPFLGIHDGLPPVLDERPGQKLRLMGNAIAPAVAIPIFQAINAALQAS